MSQNNQRTQDKLCYACGSTTHQIKTCDSKANIFIMDTKRDPLDKQQLKMELREFGNIKSVYAKKDQNCNNRNIGMVCFELEEEAEKAIEFLNNTHQYKASL